MGTFLDKLLGRGQTTIALIGGGRVTIKGVSYDIEDGATLTIDRSVSIGSIKVDLGPEMTRVLNPASVEGASLLKDRLGLMLQRFDGTFEIEASADITSPVVEVTGPQHIVEDITAAITDGYFSLSGPRVPELRLHTVAFFRTLVEYTTTAPTSVRVVAKVPMTSALKMERISGRLTTAGQLGTVEAQLGYESTANFATVEELQLKTGSGCSITADEVTSRLTADIGYESIATFLNVTGSATVNTSNSCTVTLDGSIKKFTTTLGYETELTINGVARDAKIHAGSDCVLRIDRLCGFLTTTLGYESKLDVKAGLLDEVKLNTGYGCIIDLEVDSINSLEAQLGYETTLRTNARMKKGSIDTSNDCTVSATSGFESLIAKLGYESKLNVKGSIDYFALNASSGCRVNVGGTISAGSLRAQYETTVTTVWVEREVDRSAMSRDSELVITG